MDGKGVSEEGRRGRGSSAAFPRDDVGHGGRRGAGSSAGKAGLMLILCVALIGVMGVSVTLPILPKLGDVFHLDAAGIALLITCFTLPSAFMTPVAGVLADRFGRKAVLLPGLALFACGGGVRPVRLFRIAAGVAGRAGAGGRAFGHFVRHARRGFVRRKRNAPGSWVW